VADQAAQSDKHRQFVIRMSQRVCELSDSGRRVLERIARCGEGHVRSTAQGGTNTLRIWAADYLVLSGHPVFGPMGLTWD